MEYFLCRFGGLPFYIVPPPTFPPWMTFFPGTARNLSIEIIIIIIFYWFNNQTLWLLLELKGAFTESQIYNMEVKLLRQ